MAKPLPPRLQHSYATLRCMDRCYARNALSPQPRCFCCAQAFSGGWSGSTRLWPRTTPCLSSAATRGCATSLSSEQTGLGAVRKLGEMCSLRSRQHWSSFPASSTPTAWRGLVAALPPIPLPTSFPHACITRLSWAPLTHMRAYCMPHSRILPRHSHLSWEPVTQTRRQLMEVEHNRYSADLANVRVYFTDMVQTTINNSGGGRGAWPLRWLCWRPGCIWWRSEWISLACCKPVLGCRLHPVPAPCHSACQACCACALPAPHALTPYLHVPCALSPVPCAPCSVLQCVRCGPTWDPTWPAGWRRRGGSCRRMPTATAPACTRRWKWRTRVRG